MNATELDRRLARLDCEAHVSGRVLDDLAVATRETVRSTFRRRLVTGGVAALVALSAGVVVVPAAADTASMLAQHVG